VPPVSVGEGSRGVCVPKGFLAAGVSAGLKPSGNLDLALVVSERPAAAAGVFTTNRAAAAPVVVSRRHLQSNVAVGVVVNSGGANACTGARGLSDAEEMTRTAAELFGVAPEQFLVCSTGLIGSFLPMDKVASGIRLAAGSLSPDDADAARAIMTTDTVPKTAAGSHPDGWSIGGIAKGAGMIAPNMATMLAVIASDAIVPQRILQEALGRSVEASFNTITVDGDTSTNDSVLALANGASGVAPSAGDFAGLLAEVCRSLARQIVADGEGATKFVSVRVGGARSVEDARIAARRVAGSLLVKTAVYGEDANWGRIAGALGTAGVDVDFDKLSIAICGVPLLERGVPCAYDRIAQARKAMQRREIDIACELAAGDASAEILTTDLTPEYVKLNAEYEL
jgi:glutamate N-acetyltransferase / amino-acid N-acetyltransferase